MIGLPTTLMVAGVPYDIRSDYRPCLDIMVAMADPDLQPDEKWQVALEILYESPEKIPADQMEEALKQAVWFLNCGQGPSKNVPEKPRMYDWEQDEQLIFSAINKVACRELRLEPYVHFWTFLGYFNELGEGLFTHVVNIRRKKQKHKKLEKHEQEFYRENKELIDLRRQYTTADQEVIDRVNRLLR